MDKFPFNKILRKRVEYITFEGHQEVEQMIAKAGRIDICHFNNLYSLKPMCEEIRTLRKSQDKTTVQIAELQEQMQMREEDMSRGKELPQKVSGNNEKKIIDSLLRSKMIDTMKRSRSPEVS